MDTHVLKWTLLTCTVLLVGSLPAGAAVMICASIEGSLQGNFIGEHPSPMCQAQIEAFEYHHLVDADPAGRLQHRTVIFTKPIDSATVNLWRALDTREPLTVTLRLYRPAVSGGIEQHHTVELTAAVVAAIEPYVPDVLNPDTAAWVPSERIRLNYEVLTVTHEVGGATAILNN